MGIRRTIGRIGVHTALFGLGYRARLLARSELRMLAYHRVIDPAHTYDPENVSADLENFDWQMRYLRKNFDVISFEQLHSALENGEALPRRCAMLTFDDGFADNYFNAFPILKDLGLPAMFSIVTSKVGSNEMFWFDRAACLTSRAENGFELCFGTFKRKLSADNREEATASLLRFLKDQPDETRLEHIAAIDHTLAQFMPSDAELAPHYPLNWDQILLMSSGGMEFGSHTHSHPILAKLPDIASIDHELSHSRAIIERYTGKRCLAIAYPEGLEYAIDRRVFEAAERAGYAFGLTSLRGVNRLPLQGHHELERIQIHHSNDRTLFEAAIQFPEVVE